MDTQNIKSEKLFVIDDSPSALFVIEEFLKDEGFENITSFENPLKACQSISEHKGKAIVISDYKMPFLNGKELLDAMLLVNPLLKGILISGAPHEIAHAPCNYPILDKNGEFFENILTLLNDLNH